MTMSTTISEGDDHEDLVRKMRAHWREEERLQSEQKTTEALREKEQGDRFFNRLLSENQGLLAQYARAYFGGDDSLVQDGIQELVVALYQELRNLADSVHASLWESRFGYCFKALAYALFVRRLQKHYGKAKPEKDEENPAQERPYFEQRQAELVTEDGSLDPIESAADHSSELPFSRLLQTAELEALLNAIPDPKQREALWLDGLGWKQERIAERLGCSVKTVYNLIARAKAFAYAWAKQRHETHGEFSDWIDS
jgi:RNA polymerase sigma factor (sigma-70 family)